MFDLGSDLRHACRHLAARPGYTTIMIGTLALAIGATTAVFTVADTVIISQSIANRFWPGESAVGRRIRPPAVSPARPE